MPHTSAQLGEILDQDNGGCWSHIYPLEDYPIGQEGKGSHTSAMHIIRLEHPRGSET